MHVWNEISLLKKAFFKKAIEDLLVQKTNSVAWVRERSSRRS
jgi:hypothetical protein